MASKDRLKRKDATSKPSKTRAKKKTPQQRIPTAAQRQEMKRLKALRDKMREEEPMSNKKIWEYEGY